jgi:hypothetical protein
MYSQKDRVRLPFKTAGYRPFLPIQFQGTAETFTGHRLLNCPVYAQSASSWVKPCGKNDQANLAPSELKGPRALGRNLRVLAPDPSMGASSYNQEGIGHKDESAAPAAMFVWRGFGRRIASTWFLWRTLSGRVRRFVKTKERRPKRQSPSLPIGPHVCPAWDGQHCRAR